MGSRSTSIAAIAGITVAGLIAYAVYFDYKRRTDGVFRKKLRMFILFSTCWRQLKRYSKARRKKSLIKP